MTPATTAPSRPDPLRAPLTGVAVTDPSALDHPAVAIKVSDVREAHPQVGVDRADIVFAEPVGVSYTRLAAVFHSDIPERVGPVRSVRPMDAALLGPLRGILGSSMGAEWVVDYVDEVADLDNLGTLRVSGTGAYVLDGERVAPNHVMAAPEVLLDLSERTTAPPPYFRHALESESSSALVSGSAGGSVTIPYGSRWDVAWSYDRTTGRYLREQPWGPHVMADGTQISAANVVVLKVPAVEQKIGTGSGAPVPMLQLVDAAGDFVALSAGRAIEGTWSKAGANEPFVLRTSEGSELLLTPGNTWVELPEPTANVVVR